jgi:hypothetical protein
MATLTASGFVPDDGLEAGYRFIKEALYDGDTAKEWGRGDETTTPAEKWAVYAPDGWLANAGLQTGSRVEGHRIEASSLSPSNISVGEARTWALAMSTTKEIVVAECVLSLQATDAATVFSMGATDDATTFVGEHWDANRKQGWLIAYLEGGTAPTGTGFSLIFRGRKTGDTNVDQTFVVLGEGRRLDIQPFNDVLLDEYAYNLRMEKNTTTGNTDIDIEDIPAGATLHLAIGFTADKDD